MFGPPLKNTEAKRGKFDRREYQAGLCYMGGIRKTFSEWYFPYVLCPANMYPSPISSAFY